MNKHVYKAADSYRICFLISKIDSAAVSREYLEGLDQGEVLLVQAYKDPKKKKTAVSDMKEFIEDLEETLHQYKVEYLVICISDYFKVFTKEAKSEANLGYIKEVDGFKVLYCPDFKSVFYDPENVRAKIKRAMDALKNDLQGTYTAPGSMVIRGRYPDDPEAISQALEDLKKHDVLTCDIETYSLKPNKAGLTSIGFAWNKEEGIAFSIDRSRDEKNAEVRKHLKAFFESYRGKLIFHNIAFDATVLIFQLWMDDITDTEGLLKGLEVMFRDFEDTKLIAYLATNTCAGNELGLKALSQEFAGNYAQEEISNVSAIPREELLKYNLKDCLATQYVFEKYWPVMVQDDQLKIYEELFKPSTIDIVQMQLTGFPLNMNRVLEVEKSLQNDLNQALKTLNDSPYIQDFVDRLKEEWAQRANQKYKKKRVTAQDSPMEFNPRSRLQLQELLYDIHKLPVINKTDTGLPSTDSATFESLINHTDDEEMKKILQALVDFNAVDKILTAFIPAFKQAVYSPKTDWHFLIGSFNLGGTVSGRLSSSRPNLQNLPATGTKYAKPIKSCFQAPPGWLLCGLDFASLEDHISALLTKDHNKLKVYTEHFDGHSLRAFQYWRNQMPDIEHELEEAKKDGREYKVTFDDGSIRFFNEFDPEFISLRKQNASH
jgi:DNA polymerase-1